MEHQIAANLTERQIQSEISCLAPLDEREIGRIAQDVRVKVEKKRSSADSMTRDNEKLRHALSFLTGKPAHPAGCGCQHCSSTEIIDDVLRHIEMPYQALLATPVSKLRNFATVHDYFVSLK